MAKALLKALLDSNGAFATALRGLIRAITVVITAFIIELDPEKIGAIQLALEAILQVLVTAVPNPEQPAPDNSDPDPAGVA